MRLRRLGRGTWIAVPYGVPHYASPAHPCTLPWELWLIPLDANLRHLSLYSPWDTAAHSHTTPANIVATPAAHHSWRTVGTPPTSWVMQLFIFFFRGIAAS